MAKVPNEDYKKEITTKSIYPTEEIELPSKGLIYPEDNPLSSGVINMKYMTASEEDILSSQNLIKRGVVLDKLFEAMITSDINYRDLILGDKDAIMVASRILGYGKDYKVKVICPSCDEPDDLDIDLTNLKDKEICESLLNRDNEFEFITLKNKDKIIFKLLTIADDKNIEAELKSFKTIQDKSKNKNQSTREFTTRLKYMIKSINGDPNKNIIRKYVDTMLSTETSAFRKHLKTINPGIDMSYVFECKECGYTTIRRIPMTVQFFWPDAEL